MGCLLPNLTRLALCLLALGQSRELIEPFSRYFLHVLPDLRESKMIFENGSLLGRQAFDDRC